MQEAGPGRTPGSEDHEPCESELREAGTAAVAFRGGALSERGEPWALGHSGHRPPDLRLASPRPGETTRTPARLHASPELWALQQGPRCARGWVGEDGPDPRPRDGGRRAQLHGQETAGLDLNPGPEIPTRAQNPPGPQCRAFSASHPPIGPDPRTLPRRPIPLQAPTWPTADAPTLGPGTGHCLSSP